MIYKIVWADEEGVHVDMQAYREARMMFHPTDPESSVEEAAYFVIASVTSVVTPIGIGQVK